MNATIENVNPVSFEEFAKIFVTTHSPAQKLAGLQSISTSVVHNPYCQARQENADSVCSKCYADSLLRYRKNLDKNLEHNFRVLQRILKPEEVAAVRIDALYCRIESFGDCASEIQAENYTRIILANPGVHFGIWSKNFAFYFRVWDRIGKPSNCTFVLSSVAVNVPFPVDVIRESWRAYIDHVFTVWDPEEYPAEDRAGHCAGVSCRNCLKCYKAGTAFNINEALRTQTKANKAARAALEEKLNG